MKSILDRNKPVSAVEESIVARSSVLTPFENPEETYDGDTDLVCFSHLRWSFVYQRPQHLMSRAARDRRVFFVEEPVITRSGTPHLSYKTEPCGVCVVEPRVPPGSARSVEATMSKLVDDMVRTCRIRDGVLWYYTPMAFPYSKQLTPRAVIYDCMDELSMFQGAPPGLKAQEADLLRAADVVFTGGASLFEFKRQSHPNVHAIPSSIDTNHFGKARLKETEPADQAGIIPHPRLGFAGVLDERLDIALLDKVAAARPDWHFVMIGPVVKIDPATLPQHPNIHYLGQRTYDDLPAYIAGWDVALIPFARNDATRFISPTKTPEYLAAGKPVVSTSIQDVVHPYATKGLVRIADTPNEFVAAAEEAMNECRDAAAAADWLTRVDSFLKGHSWDRTWLQMSTLLDQTITKRERSRLKLAS